MVRGNCGRKRQRNKHHFPMRCQIFLIISPNPCSECLCVCAHVWCVTVTTYIWDHRRFLVLLQHVIIRLVLTQPHNNISCNETPRVPSDHGQLSNVSHHYTLIVNGISLFTVLVNTPTVTKGKCSVSMCKCEGNYCLNLNYSDFLLKRHFWYILFFLSRIITFHLMYWFVITAHVIKCYSDLFIFF